MKNRIKIGTPNIVMIYHVLSGYAPNEFVEINSCVIPNSLEDLGRFLAICTGTLRNLVCYLHRTFRNLIMHQNPPEPHQLSAPEPSGNLSAICTEPSGTSSCTRTLRNLISFLPRNPPEPCRLLFAPNLPEPHQPSVPKPSGTSSAICTGRLRNPPEPSPEPGVAAAPDRTRAILG